MNLDNLIYRLDPKTYDQLRLQCPAPIVDSKTTDVEAAFRLGVQFVLEKLRDGFVAQR